MSRLTTAGITAIFIASIAGLLDAARGNVWDLFVLFAVILAVQCLLLARTVTDRSSMTVRPDLALWLKQRAHTNGEPVADVVDRALTFYQRGLYEQAPDHSVPGDGNR